MSETFMCAAFAGLLAVRSAGPREVSPFFCVLKKEFLSLLPAARPAAAHKSRNKHSITLNNLISIIYVVNQFNYR